MNASPALHSFIDGGPAPLPVDGFDLTRPSDGAVIGRIPESGDEGVAAAVASSKACYEKHRSDPLHRRIDLIERAAQALRAHADEIARLICEDVGKPIKAARFEAGRGVDLLRGCAAAAAASLGDETVPLDSVAAGEGSFGFVRRMPYGVVAAVTPFNAPVNLLLQKLAPAVAMGNAVVVKPAPAGFRTACRLAGIFSEAGWPKGLFNVLGGDRLTAAALAAHPDVRLVSLTGGTAAGEALAKAAGAKKFLAELGSNAVNIVFADADLPAAAARIARAAFEASGQQCISAQRVLVERPALARFMPLFAAAAAELKVGAADDPQTDIGPMVSAAAAARTMDFFADARDAGADVVLAPLRDGAIVSPGILANVPLHARLWREEVFGPLAVVNAFDTLDEALALANDSPFGLQGAAFTSNLGTAMRIARDLDVGSLWINEASRFRLDMYPFGGTKQSGVGREGIRYALEELSQLKFVGIRT